MRKSRFNKQKNGSMELKASGSLSNSQIKGNYTCGRTVWKTYATLNYYFMFAKQKLEVNEKPGTSRSVCH